MHFKNSLRCFGVLFVLNMLMTLVSVAQTSPWAASGNNISNTNTGNVGIGTTNPVSALQVNGSANIGTANTGFSNEGIKYVLNLGAGQMRLWDDTGAIFIGSPSNNAFVAGYTGFTYQGFPLYGIGSSANLAGFYLESGNAFGPLIVNDQADTRSFRGLIVDSAQAITTTGAEMVSVRNHGVEQANIGYNGSAFFANSVGVGTTTPGQKLEVNGSIKLTVGSGGTILFPDGTAQSTAWTGAVCGGDYAESVQVAGGRSRYEPGDVLVVDPAAPGGFKKSSEGYSAMVAGIYSTKPGLIGRRYTSPDKAGAEVPMAMVGIVPTKVSAENGPIKTGDLLVTSATPGHAMKGTDRGQMLGAIVGKALGSLDSGTGVIEVLVSLQ